MKTRQQRTLTTIRKPITFIGVGRFTGRVIKLTITPAEHGQGIDFIRKETLPNGDVSEVNLCSLVNGQVSTNLTRQYGESARTIEHLMYALRACKINNAIVEIDGPEIPVLEGDPDLFAKAIRSTGSQGVKPSKHGIWITQTVAVTDGDKFAMLLPNPVAKLTALVDDPQASDGSQIYSIKLQGDNYFDSNAFRQTFSFANEGNKPERHGLIYETSLINTVLISGAKVLNAGGQTAHNKLVRHKVLDSVCDLALKNIPIIGHYYSYQADFSLNRKLLRKMFRDTSAWTNMSFNERQPTFSIGDDNRVDNYVLKTLNSLRRSHLRCL